MKSDFALLLITGLIIVCFIWGCMLLDQYYSGQCQNFGKMYNLDDATIDFDGGCMVKVDGRWISNNNQYEWNKLLKEKGY